MPELPEVEATRQNLQRWTEGAHITAVTRVDPKLDPALDDLVGARFDRWERRGKALAGLTDRGVLFSHLGMTGRWIANPEVTRRFVRLSIEIAYDDEHMRLAYVDARRLGDARVAATIEDAFAKLGPDAWLAPLDATQLEAALGRGTATLKERLLEQKRVAGIGNIAVIESCFRAKVHPHTPICAVSADAWRRLVPAIHAHFAHTLASTVGNDEIVYVSEGGENIFSIYRHEGDRCPARPCRGRVVRVLFLGRPTYFCPVCQPEPVA